MLAIISKYKEQLLLILMICILLPVAVLLEEVIVTLGQATGTVLRMYVEGVCIK